MNVAATEAPKIASPDQIDLTAAVRAYQGVSFSPERRGEQDRQDYADVVNGLYAELWPMAKTEEQRIRLDQEMHRFRDGYHHRLTAFHHSYSRVVSTMIAGPSNFPTRQMEKRGDAAHARLNELVEWKAKAREAIVNKIRDLRSPEEKTAEAWNALRRDIYRSLQIIQGIDSGNDRGYDRSAFTNSIAGKVERLAKAGDVEMVGRAIDFVRQWDNLASKPTFTARHKFWTFSELAAKNAVRVEAASNADAEVLLETDDARILADPSIDRVQILFADKPDEGVRSRLRSEGWRWSPREGAWQRKLTEAAKASAVRMLGAAV